MKCLRSSQRVVQVLALLVAFVALASTKVTRADDAQIIEALKQKGATVTEVRGVVTGLSFNEPAKFSEQDFRAAGQLTQLKMLGLGVGFEGKRLALFSGMSQLESLSTNGLQFTDDDLAALASLKALKSIAFFHPGKEFSGKGLAHLAVLPKLERLTFAGALTAGDEGMAAVGKLAGLEEFRVWHAGQTNDGLKALKQLPKLKRLTIGQRLTYKPPTSPNGDSVAILADIKSLEALDLQEARLTLAELQPLKQLPNLKKLTLTGIDIPAADVEQLRRDLPQVDIRWVEPTPPALKRIDALFGAEHQVIRRSARGACS